jgi:hypothetical protein
LSIDHDDTQSDALVDEPDELKFYVVRYIAKYDVTAAGGDQFAFIKGARIGWLFEDGDEMRMPT